MTKKIVFAVVLATIIASVIGTAAMAWEPVGGWSTMSGTLYKAGQYSHVTNPDGRENHYRYVLNAGTYASMVGEPACMGFDSAPARVAATDTVTLTYAVDHATANNQNFVAGVWIEAVAAGSYGWIQVSGKGNARCETSPAAGYLLVTDVGGSDFMEYGRIYGVSQFASDSAPAGTAITSKYINPPYLCISLESSVSQTFADSVLVDVVMDFPKY